MVESSVSNKRLEASSPTDLEISTAHVDTNGQILWATLRDYIDSADVGVEQCFMVYSCLFHTGDHILATKVAKGGIIELNVTLKEPCELSYTMVKWGNSRHPKPYNSWISSR